MADDKARLLKNDAAMAEAWAQESQVADSAAETKIALFAGRDIDDDVQHG